MNGKLFYGCDSYYWHILNSLWYPPSPPPNPILKIQAKTFAQKFWGAKIMKHHHKSWRKIRIKMTNLNGCPITKSISVCGVIFVKWENSVGVLAVFGKNVIQKVSTKSVLSRNDYVINKIRSEPHSIFIIHTNFCHFVGSIPFRYVPFLFVRSKFPSIYTINILWFLVHDARIKLLFCWARH